MKRRLRLLMMGLWPLLGMVLVFAAALFFSAFTMVGNSYGAEIATLLILGLLGGGLARAVVRENLVSAAFVVLVVAECALLSQLSEPWSRLWPVLIPANATGVMAGNVFREGLREIRTNVPTSRDAPVREGVQLLFRLSADLDELGKDTSAAWFRQQADELQGRMDRRRQLEACRSIIHALDNGPGRIPDLYFAHPDGSPDAARTEEYLDTIRAVRRFARRSVPPRSFFIL